jgi:hypothetical protein
MKGGDHLENLNVNQKIILKWILENKMGSYELDSSGSGQGPVVRSCKHGNEPSISIKNGQFLD